MQSKIYYIRGFRILLRTLDEIILYALQMVTFPICKINIGLNILRKRNDGFHDIETVFYPVQLCDILEVIERPVNSNLSMFNNTGLVIDSSVEKNLCVKAFRLLQADFKLPEVVIHLHKIIPFGAGLGGGSSDAAYTITSINKLFSLGLNEKEMCNYASQIGSDCAFFISSQPSIASGRGEILENLKISLSGWHIILIKSEIHISTAEAYSGVSPKIPNSRLADNVMLPIERWKDFIFNDFENHLFEKYSQLDEIKNKLYEIGAVYAAMSGSGSTIFGLFRDRIELNNEFNDCFVWNGELK